MLPITQLRMQWSYSLERRRSDHESCIHTLYCSPLYSSGGVRHGSGYRNVRDLPGRLLPEFADR